MIGHGYDSHRFAEGRRLVLGGVEIPHDRGLLGHYHNQANKVDPGPAFQWDRVVDGARKLAGR